MCKDSCSGATSNPLIVVQHYEWIFFAVLIDRSNDSQSSKNQLAWSSDCDLASGGNGHCFRAFGVTGGYLGERIIISGPRLWISNFICRYTHKKLNYRQTIIDWFYDCIASAFCLFCAPNGLFTCAQPKPAQIWLFSTTQTINWNQNTSHARTQFAYRVCIYMQMSVYIFSDRRGV